MDFILCGFHLCVVDLNGLYPSATGCFFCSALLNSYEMQGLTRTWSEPVVCSRITGRLVTTFLRVPDRLLITLEPGETRVIDRVEARLEKTRVFF
jgi:hypothetical protein